MLYIQSLIIGAVQGITEFLPISSSAHLVLIPWIFGWTDHGLVFDVALHFGTLIAIIIFFWKDWVNIFRLAFTPTQQNSKTSTGTSYPRNILWMLVFGTIPGAIAGVLLEKEAASIFRSPILVAINLIAFGLIIYLVDRYSRRDLDIRHSSFKQAIIVGLAQMLAIVPGVSRSGSTMAASRALGFNRPDAARFSFLLAAPIMFGSALYEARHFSGAMLTFEFIVAFCASLISGWLAIKYLLEYLRRGSFAVFVWYRVILAVIIMLVYLLR